MSNAVEARPSYPKRWYAGVPALAVAFAISAAYLGIPKWSSDLSAFGHFVVRSVITAFGITGLVQTASAWSHIRGTFATPGFGKHRMVVPVEGIVYLTIMFALFTGAMLTKSNMLLLVFALMAGPFIINGWMTFGMLQATRVMRTAPARAMVGELFAVELTLSNTRPLMSIWIMSVRDTIVHVREELTATVLFARVAPRSSQAGHYQLRLMRRGRFQLGPLLTFSRFPLGLVERSRLFSDSAEILVYPRIGRLSSAFRRRWLGATELVARPQPHSGVFHDEFHRLREFRTGDNPRDIHWRSSARRGELILREYQQNRDFNLAVVLDLWQPDLPKDRNPELIEQALSFAATAIVEHGRACRDAILTLSASGATAFRWQGQGTSASLESLLDGLAVLQPGSGRETIALVNELVQRLSGSTKVIVMTTRPISVPLDLHSPRVDCLRLAEMEFDQVLVYDDQPTTPHGMHAQTAGMVTASEG
jgi:uncharacterized protein (DUF58 family)